MRFEIDALTYEKSYWLFALRFSSPDGMELEIAGCRYVEKSYDEPAMVYGRLKMNPLLKCRVLNALEERIELLKERKLQCSSRLSI